MDLATSAISKDSPQNGLRPLWTYKDDIQTYLHVNNLSLLTFYFYFSEIPPLAEKEYNIILGP